MFRSKRRKTKQQKQNALINWALIIIVLVAVLHHQSKKPRTESAIAKLELPSIKVFEEAQKKILPDSPARVTVQDTESGTGAPAVCGQKASVALSALDAHDKELPYSFSKDAPLTFTIGEKKVVPALEEGLVGMKPGGTRNIFAPAAFAFGAEGFKDSGIDNSTPVRFTVTLLKLEPDLPAPETTAFRFHDTRRGMGPALLCGETSPLHITVWDTEGKQLFTTKGEGKSPISLTAGSGSQFLGLEHAAIGMKKGTNRTAIVPPAFQKTLSEGPETLKIPFPKQQTVLVDIERTE